MSYTYKIFLGCYNDEVYFKNKVYIGLGTSLNLKKPYWFVSIILAIASCFRTLTVLSHYLERYWVPSVLARDLSIHLLDIMLFI